MANESDPSALNNRQGYLDRATTRLLALLNAETRLPCKFKINGGWTLTDCPTTIYLEPEETCEGVFEIMDVFAKVQQQLNEEFRTAPFYFGLLIGVPHRFLGRQHMMAQQEQEKDNERYRHVRLKNEDHEKPK